MLYVVCPKAALNMQVLVTKRSILKTELNQQYITHSSIFSQ